MREGIKFEGYSGGGEGPGSFGPSSSQVTATGTASAATNNSIDSQIESLRVSDESILKTQEKWAAEMLGGVTDGVYSPVNSEYGKSRLIIGNGHSESQGGGWS